MSRYFRNTLISTDQQVEDARTAFADLVEKFGTAGVAWGACGYITTSSFKTIYENDYKESLPLRMYRAIMHTWYEYCGEEKDIPPAREAIPHAGNGHDADEDSPFAEIFGNLHAKKTQIDKAIEALKAVT